ncbi:MAG TPA: hypothetical protein VFS61_05870 [Anaerolineales bacterium]|nr:hypothetical protein [Anaerolineales bacterium]
MISLPTRYFAFTEKIGWQAILGAILPIPGAAVLFPAGFGHLQGKYECLD